MGAMMRDKFNKYVIHAAGFFQSLTIVILIAAPQNVMGQMARDGEETVHLPKIEVTEKALEQWEERLDSLTPVTGVTREQFEKQPSSGRLGDVIDRMPGVFMGGPPGENKDVRLRGMDKEFTRFEFDGVQLPGDGEKREFNLNRLSLFAIGEIKILRNSTAEYESDGIAGRIVAESRRIPNQLKVDFKGGFGGIQTFDGGQHLVSLGVGKRINERFGFNLFIDANRAPNQKEKRKDLFNATGVFKLKEDENEDKVSNSFNIILDAAYFYGSGEIHIKPVRFRLDEGKDKKNRVTEPTKPTREDVEDEDEVKRTSGISLTHKHKWSNNWSLDSDFSSMKTMKTKDKTKLAFKEGTAPVPSFPLVLDKTELETEDKKDRFWQIRSKLSMPFDFGLPQTLKTGFHFRFRERYRNKEKVELKTAVAPKITTGPKDNYRIEEDYWAGFIQDELMLTDVLSWGFGARLEHVVLSSASGVGPILGETFMDFNPSTHILYRFSDHVSFNGSVSRSVNRPKFDEIARFEEEKRDNFIRGNPKVEPATSINYDLGVTHATEKSLFSINLFYKEIEDVIGEVDTGLTKLGTKGPLNGLQKPISRVDNVGEGWTAGVELEQRVGWEPYGLSLWANEAFMDSELQDNNGPKRKFNDQPDLIANFGLDYDHKATGISFSVAAKFRDETEKFKTAAEMEVEEARWNLDLGLRQKIDENTVIFFDALNVTNAKKEKTKTKVVPAGVEREFEVEESGTLFIAGIRGSF